MPVEIRVPPLGESLVDAVVGTWLKSEGDAVSRGDTLLELETDKVNLDVAATEDGVLSSIARNEGDVVVVGEVLGTITEGAAASNGAQATEPAPAAEAAAPAANPGSGRSCHRISGRRCRAGGAGGPAPGRGAQYQPCDDSRDRPRRAGYPRGRDGRGSRGTARGRGGCTTRCRPSAASRRSGANDRNSSSAATPAEPGGRPEERMRMSRRRQTIATRLVEAQQTAAMLTTFNEIDMTAVMDLRAARKESFKERHGVNLGFMSFFTKASVGALKAFPMVNAEIQGNELVLKKYYDIGIAVGVDEGLVVPVVRATPTRRPLPTSRKRSSIWRPGPRTAR